MAAELKVPFLGEVPLVQSVREAGDVGRPAVLQGDTPGGAPFRDLCTTVVQRVLKTVHA